MMNIPNKISLARLFAMPIFILIYLLDFPGSKFIALGLFVLAAISDMVDGHIARKYHMVTDLGKFLDPIADKLLATTGLLCLICGNNPIIPMPYGIAFMFIMIQRDYVVTGLRQIAQLKGVIIAADKWAKIKANFLYVSLVYGLLISAIREIPSIAGTVFLKYFSIVFYVLVGITAFLIINSEIVYLAHNFHVFKEDKKVEESRVETNSSENSDASVSTTSKTKKTANKSTKQFSK